MRWLHVVFGELEKADKQLSIRSKIYCVKNELDFEEDLWTSVPGHRTLDVAGNVVIYLGRCWTVCSSILLYR